MLKSLSLAFLISFPPIYQSIHSAYSHQHHIACCDHQSAVLHQEVDACLIVSYDFYSQNLPDAPPTVSTPHNIQRINNEILPLWLPADPVIVLPSRAPPVSC